MIARLVLAALLLLPLAAYADNAFEATGNDGVSGSNWLDSTGPVRHVTKSACQNL